MIEGLRPVIDPLIPLPVLAVLAVLALIVSLLCLRARGAGTVLRVGVIWLIVGGLLNPAMVSETREPIRDLAVILIDETPSMLQSGAITAANAAAAAIEAALARHAGDLELRTVRVRHQSIADASDGSRLFDSLDRALGDVPARRFAGAVLITDGQVHDNPATARTRLPPGPVHGLIVGDPDLVDRRITVIDAPQYALVGEEFPIRFRVDDTTADPGTRVRVTVSMDGVPQPGIRVPIGTDGEIRLTPTRRGQAVIRLATQPREGEITRRNNEAVLTIQGVRDRLRVLLVSGEPYPGERTWRNLLKSDPSVDLVHFTILRPPEKQDGTPMHELSLIAFPTRELFDVKLKEFDLIIFDRYRRRGVLPSVYLDNIVRYVEEGGALLEAAGPGFAGPFSLYRTPLGTIMPAEPTGAVIEAGFQPRLADAGRSHPVTGNLPGSGMADMTDISDGQAGEPDWGRWFRLIEMQARAGHVLMQGPDGLPLLILARVGEGRVAQLASDHIWLWARGFEGGGPQAELLRRLAHWLMKEPELEEESLRLEASGDRLVARLRTQAPVPDPALSITTPDGAVRRLDLTPDGAGVWRGAMPVTRAGLYTARLETREAVALVGDPNPLELVNLAADDRLLSPLVAAAGGRVAWATQGGGEGKDAIPAFRRVERERSWGGQGWFGLVRNGRYRLTGLDSRPLLPLVLLLPLTLMLLAWCWYRETA